MLCILYILILYTLTVSVSNVFACCSEMPMCFGMLCIDPIDIVFAVLGMLTFIRVISFLLWTVWIRCECVNCIVCLVRLLCTVCRFGRFVLKSGQAFSVESYSSHVHLQTSWVSNYSMSIVLDMSNVPCSVYFSHLVLFYFPQHRFHIS